MYCLILGVFTIAPSYDPVYRFFFPVASLASFGVRVYVSLVAGGSLTTQIIPVKPSSEGRSFHPHFLMIFECLLAAIMQY